MQQKIEIPKKKKKIGFMFVGSLGFVILGGLFVARPDVWARSEPTAFIRTIGFASVVFFGAAAFYSVIKLFDNRAGLIMDEDGITDRSNASSVGLIAWEDIIGFRTVEISSTKILLIITDKPEKYIERAKNGFARRALILNNKLYGSPISIVAGTLQIKFKDMEKLIESELNKRKV